MRRFLALALLTLTAACDGSGTLLPGGGGSLTIRTLGSVVAPGASIQVVVTNEGLQSYGHGSCDVGIEQLLANRWTNVWPAADLVCDALGRTLASGGTYLQTVPAPTTEGTYRATMTLTSAGGGEVVIVSPTFEVSSTTAVELTVGVDSVAAGAVLPLTLKNLTATTWGYNLCSGGSFQRRISDTWVATLPPLALCTADLTTLGALQTRSDSTAVPVGYAAGTYRFVLRLDATTAIVTASDSFVVR